uniref:Uncharacterized protein n=1 Tax=Cacopsylla melanoneura TaxID=428564 RepID=A0A8D8SBF2_9HEMI
MALAARLTANLIDKRILKGMVDLKATINNILRDNTVAQRSSTLRLWVIFIFKKSPRATNPLFRGGVITLSDIIITYLKSLFRGGGGEKNKQKQLECPPDEPTKKERRKIHTKNMFSNYKKYSNIKILFKIVKNQ